MTTKELLKRLKKHDTVGYTEEIIAICCKYRKRLKNPYNDITAAVYSKLLLEDVFYLINRDLNN